MSARRDLSHLRNVVAERNAERQHREQVGLRTICRRRTTALLTSGRLVKEPCEWCDEPQVQAHHEDYERPEHVRWLCRRCHGRVHSGRLALPSKADLAFHRLFERALQTAVKDASAPAPPLFITVAEASTLSGLSEPHLLRAIDSGALRAIWDGGWRVRRRELGDIPAVAST